MGDADAGRGEDVDAEFERDGEDVGLDNQLYGLDPRDPDGQLNPRDDSFQVRRTAIVPAHLGP